MIEKGIRVKVIERADDGTEIGANIGVVQEVFNDYFVVSVDNADNSGTFFVRNYPNESPDVAEL